MTQREREILNWIAENPLISQQELADKAGITRSSAAAHISNLMKKGYIVGKGYIVRTAPYAVVVGGVNMDIGGRPHQKLVAQDSNPGQVRMSLGGVGRNIAHNMALMGLDVRMLTAFGDDLYAQKIAASCGELGIDISHSLQVPGAATSTYLFLSDEQGDMALAVSDMEIYTHVTPSYLSAQRACWTTPSLSCSIPTSPRRPSPGWPSMPGSLSSPIRSPPPRRKSSGRYWESSIPSSPTASRRNCSPASPSPTRPAFTEPPTFCWRPGSVGS